MGGEGKDITRRAAHQLPLPRHSVQRPRSEQTEHRLRTSQDS
jgi:hypothetical protein